MMADPIASVGVWRKHLGRIFLMAGVLHWGLMIFASLYALGKFPSLTVSVEEWQQAYFGYSLFLFFSGAGYIAIKYSRGDILIVQALLDWLLGVIAFEVLFRLVRAVLVRGSMAPWLSLVPGLFLLYYGMTLYRGRQIWSRLELL